MNSMCVSLKILGLLYLPLTEKKGIIDLCQPQIYVTGRRRLIRPHNIYLYIMYILDQGWLLIGRSSCLSVRMIT